MQTKCMGSAGSKEALEALINKQFYSTSWVITDDNKLYNTKLNKYMDDTIVRVTAAYPCHGVTAEEMSHGIKIFLVQAAKDKIHNIGSNYIKI